MKKLIAALMTVLLLMSVSAYAESTASSWAASEIMSQMPSLFVSVVGDIDYQRPLTRSEACMLIFQVYSKLNGQLSGTEIKQKFSDVGAETSDMFIPFLYDAGIVNGVSETEFAPRAHVKRQELCAMICRTLEKLDENAKSQIEAANGGFDNYADSAEIADWANHYVSYCVNRGYIKGMTETILAPSGDVSVEQAMVICSRIVKEKLTH